jgi:hypothetical protein
MTFTINEKELNFKYYNVDVYLVKVISDELS